MGPRHVVTFLVRAGLGVMTIKIYTTLSKSPKVERHPQMQVRVMPKTSFFAEGSNTSEGDTVSIFKHCRQGVDKLESMCFYYG